MYAVKTGLIDYKYSIELQHRILEAKYSAFPDILLFPEYDPVVTMGHRGKKENILISESELSRRRISLFPIERGGDVTYHGPGQIIGYPIINLSEYRLKIKDFIEKLEEVLIRTLRSFDIEGTRNQINHGVWFGNDKIVSIGIGIKRWITFHGFAFNVNIDPDEFGIIRPCGLYNTGITSLRKIKGFDVSLSDVINIITHNFSAIFNTEIREISFRELVERIESFESNKKTSMAQNETSLGGRL